MSFSEISKNILIIALQITIMKNAEQNGWNVRRLNDKQIELTKKLNTDDDYEKICHDLFKSSLMCMNSTNI